MNTCPICENDNYNCQCLPVRYSIPEWCGMDLWEHFPIALGCWGILYGYVSMQGESYCKKCEYYISKKKENNNV